MLIFKLFLSQVSGTFNRRASFREKKRGLSQDVGGGKEENLTETRGVCAGRGGGELRLILFVGSMKVKAVHV